MPAKPLLHAAAHAGRPGGAPPGGDVVRGAHAAEQRVQHRHLGCGSGHVAADMGQDRYGRCHAQVHRLAAHVGACVGMVGTAEFSKQRNARRANAASRCCVHSSLAAGSWQHIMMRGTATCTRL